MIAMKLEMRVIHFAMACAHILTFLNTQEGMMPLVVAYGYFLIAGSDD
jgi:hypothetical protein